MKLLIFLISILLIACGGQDGSAPASEPQEPDNKAPSDTTEITTSCQEVVPNYWVKYEPTIYWVKIYDSLDECQRNIFPHYLREIGECQVRSSYLTGAYEFCYSDQSTEIDIRITIEELIN